MHNSNWQAGAVNGLNMDPVLSNSSRQCLSSAKISSLVLKTLVWGVGASIMDLFPSHPLPNFYLRKDYCGHAIFCQGRAEIHRTVVVSWSCSLPSAFWRNWQAFPLWSWACPPQWMTGLSSTCPGKEYKEDHTCTYTKGKKDSNNSLHQCIHTYTHT